MKRRDGLLVAIGWPAALCIPPAAAQTDDPRVLDLKPLGQDRFQLGRIVVDKRSAAFTLPGRVIVLGKPLEYLACSPRGRKAYETLLELDTFGSEFNLACILIGLERDPRDALPRQSPQTALFGPRVALSLAWSEDGKRRKVSAATALLDARIEQKPESVEWVYTGSRTPDGQGRFVADYTGTLIGFIPDANCVILSAVPIGFGAYGSVHGNAMLPPVGTALELIVEAVPSAK